MAVHAFVPGSLGLYCGYIEAGEECERRRVDAIHAVAALSPRPPSAKGLSSVGEDGTRPVTAVTQKTKEAQPVKVVERTNGEEPMTASAPAPRGRPRSEHGTNSRYDTGCRCDPCRAAHADAMRAYMARRAEREGRTYQPRARPVSAATKAQRAKPPTTKPEASAPHRASPAPLDPARSSLTSGGPNVTLRGATKRALLGLLLEVALIRLAEVDGLGAELADMLEKVAGDHALSIEVRVVGEAA